MRLYSRARHAFPWFLTRPAHGRDLFSNQLETVMSQPGLPQGPWMAASGTALRGNPSQAASDITHLVGRGILQGR